MNILLVKKSSSSSIIRRLLFQIAYVIDIRYGNKAYRFQSINQSELFKVA